MSDKALNSDQRHGKKKGGKFLPALCNILGTLILAAVILSFLPMSVPRLLGYEIFNVVSGSMEPAIPVGSVVYVKPADPAEIRPEDVIAFQRDGVVITHRVAENSPEAKEFITKGDANEGEDLEPVPYRALIGCVTLHLPALGNLMALYTSLPGKLFVLILAACGAVLNMLASRLRERAEE